MFTIDTLAVVGVGLLGGSVGLAARRRHVAGRVIGLDRQPAALGRALERGILDETAADLPAVAARADVIVFCTPVDGLAGQVLEAAPHCRSGCLLTDVGSTKEAIVACVQGRLPPGVAFVGAHPLAGSEKEGPGHARADLFEGKLVVLTPGADAAPEAIARTTAFWQALGARIEIMDARAHDEALALTSHLPHLVASALAGLLPADLQRLTATGFRDATRLAAGSPTLWSAIFRTNRAAVLSALDLLQQRLTALGSALRHGDREILEQFLQQGKQVRDALDRPPG